MEIAVNEVFEELSKLTPEEFEIELAKHRNTDRAKAIEYALNHYMEIGDEK